MNSKTSENFRIVGVSSLADYLNENTLGDYEIEESSGRMFPERNSFIDMLRGTSVVAKRTLFLYGPAPAGLVGQLLGLAGDSDRVIARVSEEIGEFREEDPSSYEFLKVRFLREIQLNSGVVIPKSTIKIYTEVPEWGEINLTRRDHIRKCGLYWSRTNLSKILPTSLFLADPDMPYKSPADLKK